MLSTVHSAKGGEWEVVHVLHASDGNFPSDMATGDAESIEEERRLLYVAMTRAKDSLHLVMPQRFYVSGQAARGDRHVYASRTRFIPDHILDRFEQCFWPRSAFPIGAAARLQVRVDLRAKMRGAWK